MNIHPILASVVLGLIISVILSITRSKDDNNKGVGAYIIKCMIVVCPVVYIGVAYLSNTNVQSGGSSIPNTMEMNTGVPDF